MIIQIMIDGQIEESGKSSFTPPFSFSRSNEQVSPYLYGWLGSIQTS